MTSRPTYDDANLILRLYNIRREARLRQARAWFGAHCKFKTHDELLKLTPGGSEENASFRMVVSYWDMVASFITSGVLHKELFFQSGRELLLVWERLRDVIGEIRRAQKDPHLYRHLETVGTEFAEYYRSRSQEGYEAFLKRIK
jgi:hypothetical protein